MRSFSFALFFFAYYAYVGSFTPYAGLYFADRGMGAAEIGILMSLMQVTRIFGPGMWAWVADHTQRRVNVLRLTAFAALIIFSGLWLGKSFAVFFVVMFALNTCTGAQAPLSDALMLAEMRGDLTQYGRLRLWGSVGFILAVAGGGRLLDFWGIGNMPWLCWSLLALVLLASLYLRETPHVPLHHDTPSIRSVLQRREVQTFFLSTFLMVAAHAALYIFYSLYLAQLGYSKTVIGLMWSLGVVAEIVFFYCQAPLFRRLGVRFIMLAAVAVACVRFLMIGLGAQSLALLLLAQVLHAATFAAHHSASVMTMQRWFSGPLQARGQALYVSISYGLGGSFGGLVLSLLWDEANGRAVFLAAALLALGAWVAAIFTYRQQQAVAY
ncbi:MAG TPA: MFS transporter [Burkholderiaceae bacterium]